MQSGASDTKMTPLHKDWLKKNPYENAFYILQGLRRLWTLPMLWGEPIVKVLLGDGDEQKRILCTPIFQNLVSLTLRYLVQTGESIGKETPSRQIRCIKLNNEFAVVPHPGVGYHRHHRSARSDDKIEAR